jgi:hypothetical protein
MDNDDDRMMTAANYLGFEGARARLREDRNLGLAPVLAEALAKCYGIHLPGLDLIEQGRWIRMAQLAIDFVAQDETLDDAALNLEGRLRERLEALEEWRAAAPERSDAREQQLGDYRSMDNAGRQLVTVDGQFGCRWSGPGRLFVGDQVRLQGDEAGRLVVPEVGEVTALATRWRGTQLVTITGRA